MKISLGIANCCVNTVCIYRKECAQHVSASEFREESGFAPQITKDLNCLTADEPPIENIREVLLPANYKKLSYGYQDDPFSYPSTPVSDYRLTEDDTTLLQRISEHLYRLHHGLDRPLERCDNADQTWAYAAQLDKLITAIKLENFEPETLTPI